MKYTLKVPIEFGENQTLTELNLREKVVTGDMRGLPMRDPMHHDEVIKLIARLSAQPDPVIHRMAIADYMEVSAIVARFISPRRETGSELSLSLDTPFTSH